MFSLTSLGEGVQSKGEMSDSIKDAEFKLNIILFGIEMSRIESIFKDLFHSSFPHSSDLIQKETAHIHD